MTAENRTQCGLDSTCPQLVPLRQRHNSTTSRNNRQENTKICWACFPSKRSACSRHHDVRASPHGLQTILPQDPLSSYGRNQRRTPLSYVRPGQLEGRGGALDNVGSMR